MKDTITSAATIILAIAAIAVSASAFRGSAGNNGRNVANRADLVLNWQDYVSQRNWRGPRDATLIITEFSDFQCPACAENARLMDEVLADYPNIAHSYRHFPIQSAHPHALTAALATECANMQGKFWELHDALFRHQGKIGTREWSDFARDAGIPDTPAFEACMNEEDDSEIAADAVAARQLGASGTPTILINDVLLRGVPRREFLDSLLVSLRNRSK